MSVSSCLSLIGYHLFIHLFCGTWDTEYGISVQNHFESVLLFEGISQTFQGEDLRYI